MNNFIRIRSANREDSSNIAPLLLLAMGDIFYQFMAEKSEDKALLLLTELIETKNNQYAYENCFVAELDGIIVGSACIYDGAKLEVLRNPVKQLIEKKQGVVFNPEDETQSGEMYIDTVGVNPTYQGIGVGSAMFSFLIKHFVEQQHKTLGLLVEKDNVSAKKLYDRLGFTVVGSKTLMGKPMHHMQIASK